METPEHPSRLSAMWSTRLAAAAAERLLLRIGPPWCLLGEREEANGGVAPPQLSCSELARFPLVRVKWPTVRGPNPSGAESEGDTEIETQGDPDKGRERDSLLQKETPDQRLCILPFTALETRLRQRIKKVIARQTSCCCGCCCCCCKGQGVGCCSCWSSLQRGRRFPFLRRRDRGKETAAAGAAAGAAAAPVVVDRPWLGDGYVSDSSVPQMIRSPVLEAAAAAAADAACCDHFHCRSSSSSAAAAETPQQQQQQQQQRRRVVPLVRFGECDLTFNHQGPLHNSRLLRAYSVGCLPIVQQFLRLLKFWVKKRDIA